MKNLNILVTILLLFNVTLTCAQEITPELKYSSIRAPANIKVDGKADEWNNQFHAYSHQTQFYYTISNNDKYLYLTIQATDWFIIGRILNGGITFTINKAGVKNYLEGKHITYPMVHGFIIPFKSAPKIKKGSTAFIAAVDSFVKVHNDRMERRSKFIKVMGIKNVDTITSIYNLDGIKAAASIDNNYRYTYELAISLNDLELSPDGPAKFTYQVMINEIEPEKHAPGEVYVEINFPGFGEQFATDFWGEYTLAK